MRRKLVLSRLFMNDHTIPINRFPTYCRAQLLVSKVSFHEKIELCFEEFTFMFCPSNVLTDEDHVRWSICFNVD